MSKTSRLSRRRAEAHAEMLERNSKVYKAFLDLERAAFADGALPKKTKELVAIGISVVVNCESCMQWHISSHLRACYTRHSAGDRRPGEVRHRAKHLGTWVNVCAADPACPAAADG